MQQSLWRFRVSGGISMKTAFAGSALLVMALAFASVVGSSDDPDRPPGIAKDAWILITANVGFVVVPRTMKPAGGTAQPLALAPSVSGYFMLKRASLWSRIVVVEPLRGTVEAGE